MVVEVVAVTEVQLELVALVAVVLLADQEAMGEQLGMEWVEVAILLYLLLIQDQVWLMIQLMLAMVPAVQVEVTDLVEKAATVVLLSYFVGGMHRRIK
jgi:hypothetical protein